MTHERARQALDHFYGAVNRLQHGDAGPMLALWSHSAEVTHVGPRGGRETGWDQVHAYYHQVAELTRAAPGAVRAEGTDIHIMLGSDLAYATMRELVSVTADGRTFQFTARATHVYRRESEAWKLVHRHADPAPPLEQG